MATATPNPLPHGPQIPSLEDRPQRQSDEYSRPLDDGPDLDSDLTNHSSSYSPSLDSPLKIGSDSVINADLDFDVTTLSHLIFAEAEMVIGVLLSYYCYSVSPINSHGSLYDIN